MLHVKPSDPFFDDYFPGCDHHHYHFLFTTVDFNVPDVEVFFTLVDTSQWRLVRFQTLSFPLLDRWIYETKTKPIPDYVFRISFKTRTEAIYGILLWHQEIDKTKPGDQ